MTTPSSSQRAKNLSSLRLGSVRFLPLTLVQISMPRMPSCAAEGAWIAPDRDAHELALLAGARERGLPVLGICRGLQLANVALGGDLVEHVDGHDAGDRVEHEPHAVRIAPGTLLHDATGRDEIAVNTLHHQTVGTLAPGLVRSATAQDGVPEAAEATDGPWLLAVQWHPELMGDAPGGRDLFAALVAHA